LVTLQAHVEVHLMSIAPTASYYEIVSQPAPATNITSHDANWEDYGDLLELLGKANGQLISDNEVKLYVLIQISTGEN
jgi:exonuclease V gamma subunit